MTPREIIAGLLAAVPCCSKGVCTSPATHYVLSSGVRLYACDQHAGRYQYGEEIGCATAIRAALALLAAPDETTDDPELDGTDGAHPAWWRGNDRGVEATTEKIAAALDGHYDSQSDDWRIACQPLDTVVRRVVALRRVAEAARGVVAQFENAHCEHTTAFMPLVEALDALDATKGAA